MRKKRRQSCDLQHLEDYWSNFQSREKKNWAISLQETHFQQKMQIKNSIAFQLKHKNFAFQFTTLTFQLICRNSMLSVRYLEKNKCNPGYLGQKCLRNFVIF